MSRLEQLIDAGRLVITAEMPVIDGGGLPEINRQLAPMKAYLDAVNATDNTAAHAHAYIDEKVPGISIPAATIARVERAGDQQEAAFDVACELAERALALPGVAGLHLISFRKDAGIAALCRRLGIPTRAEREASGNRHPVTV